MTSFEMSRSRGICCKPGTVFPINSFSALGRFETRTIRKFRQISAKDKNFVESFTGSPRGRGGPPRGANFTPRGNNMRGGPPGPMRGTPWQRY
uniref:Uncharacterized protein n=1 Tax=Caenorhabditis japonica TaxID=281687 RepID=A0A8R1ERF6_CAEJA